MAKKQVMSFDEALQVILASSGDNPLRQMLEAAMQRALELEMSEHLGAEPYERTGERRGYRNGYKHRVFTTAVGDLQLLIPQDRDGNFSTALFERYQRCDKALVLSLMEMYIQGVSTRNVASITERLCGRSFSSQLVSKLAADLDGILEDWRTRRLGGEAYPYLFVDALYQKVRDRGRVVSKGILVVTGVNTLGRREILSIGIADTENTTTWSDAFRDLKDRGVSGVLLVTSDDHEGIKAAVSRYFQGASWQRCQFHFVRNVLPLCPKRDRKGLSKSLRSVFDAGDMSEARRLAREIVDVWQEKKPVLADRIEEGMTDALACFWFPPSHRKKIRTSNMVEWFNGELRRRTRVVRIFPSESSALRLMTALSMEQSEEWETQPRKYIDIDKLEDWVDIEMDGYVPWLKGPRPSLSEVPAEPVGVSPTT